MSTWHGAKYDGSVVCPACGYHHRVGARFCEACGAALVIPGEPSGVPATVGVGRYRVQRMLGEGARKQVYAALDTRLDREVAVAVIKTEGLDDAGRYRIAREARAMARLGDHPHIVTVFDVGEEDGQPYIVSQLMPGGSIGDQLASSEGRRLPVEEALRITEQIALALEHAHGLGVVHRDLKPANVWLATDRTARLGDFGLAAPVDQSRVTSEGMVVGTVAYLAPEQALGRPPDRRADLYSLGVVLYEMLTGRPPFLGDDAVAVISQHLNTAPVAPTWHNSEVAPLVERLVMRLLAKDPAQRPQAAEVIAEIRRIRESSIEPVPTPVHDQRPVGGRLGAAEWGRFVGRVDELATLKSALDEALGGRSGLAMVVGEPGIGKTRLVEELATYGAVRSAQVCWGRCYETEIGIPYLPFVEALRGYVRERTDQELRAELSTGAPELATLVSDLRERLPDLPESLPLEGDAERLRLFEGVTTFMHNAAANRPLVLVLDDLHWADKPSLLLLQYLARNLRRDRMLMIGTYRDIELNRTHPLADTVATLRREHLFERVLLRGLPRNDVKSLIEAIGDQEPPDDFADLVHRETEGNPFFVAEILRDFAETGAIQRVDGRWVGTPESVAANLPEGIREVIGRRLDRLSRECNRMLTAAAAMPGGFTVDVVSTVTEVGEDDTLDLLDEALTGQIVRERRDSTGVYEFTHALIRQTLYGELNTPRRVRLHRQIATALEERFATSLEAHLPELAYHAFQGAPGGDVDKAIDYATRAALRARSQAAHDEAARLYDLALQALELTDAVDPIRRAGLLLDLGDARRRAGDVEVGLQTQLDAADLLRQSGDARLFAQAAVAFSSNRLTPAKPDNRLVSLVEEALARLGAQDDALQARLLALIAQHVAFVDRSRSEVYADEAIATARRSGDRTAQAQALMAVRLAHGIDLNDDSLERLESEITAIVDGLGDPDLIATSLGSHVFALLMCGDRNGANASLVQLAELAYRLRAPNYDAMVISYRAQLAMLEGRYSQGHELASGFRRIARRTGDDNLTAQVGIIVYPALREQGGLETLAEPTRSAVAASPDVVGWRAGLTAMLTELGELDEARHHYEVLVAVLDELPHDFTWIYAVVALASAAVALGDTPGCERLYDLLRPHATRHAMIGYSAYHGAVAHYLGRLARVLERHADALRHLEAAVDAHERMQARPWAARSRYELASALVVRGEPGDPQRALGLLNQALDSGNELGMARLVEQALEVKLELQGVASSSPQLSIDVVAAQVSVERPDLRHQATSEGLVTLMFSDIEGYTELTERLGDARTQDVLRAHNEIIRREVAAHQGSEVKSQGDGFMLAFADPADALACAIAIQHRVAAHEFSTEVDTVRVRIGIHTGEVIREGSDFFGRTVIVAARLTGAARGGQILVTKTTRQLAPDTFNFDDGRSLGLKGIRAPQQVHSLMLPAR